MTNSSMKTHSSRNNRRSIVALALVAGFAIVAVGCNNFLAAENPGAVEEPDVNNPAYAGIITNGPIYAYQLAHTDAGYWNGQFTDELYNRAVFAEEGQIDRRELNSDMTYINAFSYGLMQRSRYLGEDAARRLKILLGDTATRDLRIARSLAYAAQSYVELGEMMCVTPIDLGVPKSSTEMMTDAVTRFDEAIAIATAAKTYLQSINAAAGAIAATDSVKNFALVGAARASLNKNDKVKALAYAIQVPTGFDFRAYYTDNTTGQRNRSYERLVVGKNAFMRNTPFDAMAGDPRIPRLGGTSANASTPMASSSYSTWNNTPTGVDFAPVMSLRIASYLEAQYIIAEANGPTAETATFVAARRAAGLQPVAVFTGDALMAELRDQKSRDFYLDNHRLGDLRRYKQFYAVDLFPKGPYPGTTSGQVYNELVTCWPLPTNEINGNPNIPK